RFCPGKALKRETNRRLAQRGGGQPIAALERITNRNRGDGVSRGQVPTLTLAKADKFVDHLFGWAILRDLQIGVFEIVHRVEGFLVIAPRPAAVMHIVEGGRVSGAV